MSDPVIAKALEHHGRGELQQAQRLYRLRLLSKPDDFDALHLLGVALMQTGAFQEAEARYRRALFLRPDFAALRNNYGIMLAERGRLMEAIEQYRRAIALEPAYVDALGNLGNALSRTGAHGDAVGAYNSALKLRPDFIEARHGRAFAALELGELNTALQDFEFCFERGGLRDECLAVLALLRQGALDWQSHDHLIALIEEKGAARCTTPFAMLVATDRPDLQRSAAAAFVGEHFAAPKIVTRAVAPKDSKLRVAYISADFRDHPAARLLVAMLEGHDRERFETLGVSIGPDDGSDLRRRMERAFDEFVDVRSWSAEQVVSWLREQRVDIAVDLMGHTRMARTQIFAERAAPIQVSYLGYPGTMGADFIDYIIADRVVLPSELEASFSEKVCRLPSTYFPSYPLEAPIEVSDGLDREHFGLPRSAFVFASFGNLWKLTPRMFDVWMELLRSTPDSVLWILLKSDAVERKIRAEAEKRGVKSERLVRARPLPNRDHLARHKLADLLLDTYPYNGHTTTLDALAAGVPVVACAGYSFASRVSASLLSAAAVPELVATGFAEYGSLTRRLASDPEALLPVRRRLADAASSKLFDLDGYRSALEQGFLQMAAMSRAGSEPASFDVAP